MPRLHTRADDVGFAGTMIDRGWVRVAEADTGIGGFIAREASEIHALYVQQDQRGQGCGHTLLRAEMAQSAVLELWTFAANTSAQGFYKAMGFEEIARTDGAENDEGLPDIRYRWQREEGAQ